MDEFFCKKSEKILAHRFTEPKRSYQEACEMLQHGIEHTDSYETAYAYLYIGDALFSLGRVEEAINKIHLGEQIQKQHGYEDLLMRTYNTAAIICMAQGDALLALDYYYQAMYLAKKNQNYEILGIIYNNIGVLLNNFDDSAGAAEYFEKSYQVSRENNLHDAGIVYNERQVCVNICGKYLAEKKYQRAKEYLDQVMERTDQGQPHSMVTEMSVIATYVRIYDGLGDYDMTYKEALKVFQLPEECYDELECSRNFIWIVRIFIKMNHLKEAKEILLNLEREWAKNGVLNCKLELCRAWIMYDKAAGEKENLQRAYHRYYDIRQSRKQEEDQAVIEAIDNRYRLEHERVLNEQLDAGNRELAQKSETDELTGISNRYGLNRKFENLKKIAVFEDTKICMGIFDIDYYKIYNDTYGHMQGDTCLKKIAQILQETAGDDYITARYGGDEFIILGMDKTNAEVVAFVDRLFSNVKTENMEFAAHPVTGRVTISMGVVNRKTDREDEITDFIHEADKMLYQAKKNGKNQYFIPFSC